MSMIPAWIDPFLTKEEKEIWCALKDRDKERAKKAKTTPKSKSKKTKKK